MDLATDLRLLRQLRVPFKADLIQWVSHIWQYHPVAMTGLDGKDLKDLVFSSAPTEEIAKILETAPAELKGPTLDKLLARARKLREGRQPSGARTARRSSRHTDSNRKRSRKGSQTSSHAKTGS